MRDLSDITPSQIRVLEIMWRREAATAGQVLDDLGEDEGWARTTVATTLARMAQYGWLRRARSGRDLEYQPVVTRSQVRAAQVGEIVGSLFSDDLPSFVSHALESGDWEEADLERIEQMLKGYRNRKRRKRRR